MRCTLTSGLSTAIITSLHNNQPSTINPRQSTLNRQQIISVHWPINEHTSAEDGVSFYSPVQIFTSTLILSHCFFIYIFFLCPINSFHTDYCKFPLIMIHFMVSFTNYVGICTCSGILERICSIRKEKVKKKKEKKKKKKKKKKGGGGGGGGKER